MRTAGEHTVQYRGTDAAGNVSSVGSVSFRIDPGDTTAPTVSARLSPAQPNGPNGRYRSRVTVIVDATDDRPGAVRIEYRLDGGAWTRYTTPVVVNADGRHTVEYRATDTAGNTSAVRTATFRIERPRAAKPSVRLVGGRDLGDIARRGLRVEVTCPLECRASSRLRVSRHDARRLRAGRVIGRSDARVIRAGRTATLVVGPDRELRRDIARLMRRAGMRQVSAVLVTRIRTASGVETVEKRLRLRR